MTNPDAREELIKQISDEIQRVSSDKEISKVKSLSRHAPEKVAEVLYLFSTGTSQTKLVKKYGYARQTVINIITDYADVLGKFRELSGKIAA